MRPSADAKRIRIDLDADPAAGYVNGDEGRLRQVFWNLLVNAVKFTGEDGRIAVDVAAAGHAVTIAIRDSGIGIDPAFLPHVFEPFRQADAGVARSFGGLGLGLAICKQLAELHGGSMTVSSQGLGLGATFTVRLPRHAPERQPVEGGAASPVTPVPELPTGGRLDGVDILVVDDEQDNLELLRHVLEQVGAHVRIARTAAAALQQVDARPPDLLVADVGLPLVDGCELLRQIRSRTAPFERPVPAIAVTSHAHSDDRLRTRAAGFQDHIARPIDPEAFLRAVVAAAQQPA